MKKLQWWMRIAGAFYLLLTLMQHYRSEFDMLELPALSKNHMTGCFIFWKNNEEVQ